MTDEVLRDAVGHKIKEIAFKTGLSKSFHYQELSGKTKNILDRVKIYIDAEDGDSILQWLCNENEGYFVKRLTAGNSQNQVIAKLLLEFSEVMKVVADALMDGKVSMREYKNIRSEWTDVQAVMEGFLDAVERGEFD